MLQPIRRIVTGVDSKGRSVITSDESSPHVLQLLDKPAFGMTNLWVTDVTPVDTSDDDDPAARTIQLAPPKGGSIFRVVEFPPDKDLPKEINPEAAFKVLAASEAMDRSHARHPFMHKTSTIDYAIVISGEIYAILDEGETLLRQGDCLVQRGTNHAWSNRSSNPCLVAFILIDAHPLDK
jgi:hypothetical protein